MIKYKISSFICAGIFLFLSASDFGTEAHAADSRDFQLQSATSNSKLDIAQAIDIAKTWTDMTVISAELKMTDDLPAYEISLLSDEAQKMTLMVNAITGELFAAQEDSKTTKPCEAKRRKKSSAKSQ